MASFLCTRISLIEKADVESQRVVIVIIDLRTEATRCSADRGTISSIAQVVEMRTPHSHSSLKDLPV